MHASAGIRDVPICKSRMLNLQYFIRSKRSRCAFKTVTVHCCYSETYIKIEIKKKGDLMEFIFSTLYFEFIN